MSEERDVHDRPWQTTVQLKRGFMGPAALVFDHRGPADFKLDGEGNLRVEVYPENSDFEVVIALVLAGTFFGVSQEEVEDCIIDDEDENCPCEDCGDGTPRLEATLASDNVFDDED